MLNSILTSFFVILLTLTQAQAQDIPPSPIVKTQLLVDAPSINPGDTIWAGVAFTMPPQWHIYAKDPGDSGIPTSYEWTLPEGITAGEIIWPPHEKIELGGFVNYGYSDHVILPVPLKVTAAPASNTITVKAVWLACEKVCIPESATLSASVPFHDEGVAKKLAAARGEKLPEPATSWVLALALAFLGGLLLNIMPCVLPILSLKALTLVKKSQVSPALARAHGITYTAGVVVSFLAIAGVMLGLRASGEAIGWGFQLQSPWVVGVLALLMFAVSANLAGLFELPILFGEVSISHEKLRGSFFTGALAVAVATPCTAPFMAGAVGATLLMPMAQALSVFAAMGLGMASPFLLISLSPAAIALLPKPGAWMHRFKQVLSIPMLLTALWLLGVLAQLLQAPASGPMPMSDSYRIVTVEHYSAERLKALRAQATPVLLDATAAWCLSCKVNERVALKPEAMQQFLKDHGVTLMIADWTMSDPEITALLAEFGRNGVPLYVYYPTQGDPLVLPQVLTPSLVKEAVTRSPSR